MASRVIPHHFLKRAITQPKNVASLSTITTETVVPLLPCTTKRVHAHYNMSSPQYQQYRCMSKSKGGKMGKHLETLKEMAHEESHRQAQERHKYKKQKKDRKSKKKHVEEQEETPVESSTMQEEEDELFELNDINEDELPTLPDPNQVKERMLKVVTNMEESFRSIRGAEPTPELFDSISVQAYGEPTPLSAVAQVVITSPTLATITCFDPSIAKDVKTAIMVQLEFNPQVEGGELRVPLPRPSAQARQQTVKQLSQKAEAGRTRIRNIRRSALDICKKGTKGKLQGISKDDAFRVDKEINAITEEAIAQLNHDEQKQWIL